MTEPVKQSGRVGRTLSPKTRSLNDLKLSNLEQSRPRSLGRSTSPKSPRSPTGLDLAITHNSSYGFANDNSLRSKYFGGLAGHLDKIRPSPGPQKFNTSQAFECSSASVHKTVVPFSTVERSKVLGKTIPNIDGLSISPGPVFDTRKAMSHTSAEKHSAAVMTRSERGNIYEADSLTRTQMRNPSPQSYRPNEDMLSTSHRSVQCVLYGTDKYRPQKLNTTASPQSYKADWKKVVPNTGSAVMAKCARNTDSWLL